MIIDMLEVHEQNLRTRRGRRAPNTPSPSVSVSARRDHATPTYPSAPVNADAVAIMARIKEKLSICDGLLIESI